LSGTIASGPGSPWPAELKARGYPIRWIEDGERILPYDVREVMTINARTAF
jgi:hypothetical protein